VDLLENELTTIPVIMGEEDFVKPYISTKKILIEKGDKDKIRREVNIPKTLKAPILKDQPIGEVKIYSGNDVIASQPIFSENAINKKSLKQIFFDILEVLYAR
jgi:D-alanyl-D-alanine carboxypeptidase (penicillin-binding protein 5/6)